MSDLICQKCGSKNPAWYADNDLFNKVISEILNLIDNVTPKQ